MRRVSACRKRRKVKKVKTMTKYELKKAQELNEEIERLKECVDYFSPVTSGRYNSFGRLSPSAENTLKKRFPFTFKLSKKDNKTANCELHLQGYGGGMPIWVDKEFVDYCKVYFEEKLKEAEIKFANIQTESKGK